MQLVKTRLVSPRDHDGVSQWAAPLVRVLPISERKTTATRPQRTRAERLERWHRVAEGEGTDGRQCLSEAPAAERLCLECHRLELAKSEPGRNCARIRGERWPATKGDQRLQPDLAPAIRIGDAEEPAPSRREFPCHHGD